MYTHFTFTLMAHCTSGAIRGFSVLLKDASTGNRTSNLQITKRLLYHCTTVAPMYHCRPQIPQSTSYLFQQASFRVPRLTKACFHPSALFFFLPLGLESFMKICS